MYEFIQFTPARFFHSQLEGCIAAGNIYGFVGMDATCQGWDPAHNTPAGAGPLGSLHFFCDDGFESTNACPGNPIIKSVPDPDPCDATPHPIGFSSGNKYLMEGDFNAFGASSNLSLTRTYNSVSGIFNDILGNQWNSSFSRRVYYDKIAGSAFVHRSGGRMYYFEITNNIWKTDADITDKLTMSCV